MADKTLYCGHCGEEAVQSCNDCSDECQAVDQ